MKEFFRKIFFPLPSDQAHQGFSPNWYIKFLRLISDGLIAILRLNKDNRFSNEFIQRLNPIATAVLPNGHDANLIFRAGHGRLYWRAKASYEEEKLLLEWIDSMPKEACYYDIGANVGNFALYSAYKDIQTYAFEAELLNVSLMYESVFLNGLQNKCIILPYCLSKQSQMDTFFLKDVSKGDALHSAGKPSHMLGDEALKRLKTMPIPTFALDDLVKLLKLPQPAYIKLDVDGNELQVIEGGIETFSKTKEIHIELDMSSEEHRKALYILNEIGFEIKAEEPILREWNKTQSNYLLRNNKNVA